MGDKTPTKARKVESPWTPRQAEKRDAMVPSPRSRRSLDYDHMATLINKKPKIVEQDSNELSIKALTPGDFNNKRLLLNIICYIEYTLAAKILACDDSGVIVISAYGRAKTALLHVAKNQHSCIELTDFTVSRPHYMYPTASYNGMEIEMYDGEGVRTFGPAADFHPKSYFVNIDTVIVMSTSTVVDVLGVIVMWWDEADPDSSDPEDKPALQVSIFDNSQQTILLSLWGNDFNYLRSNDNLIGKVIAVKRALTSGFGGKPSLQSLWYTQVELDPPTKQASHLLSWYQDFAKQVQERAFRKESHNKKPDAKDNFY